MSASRVVTRGQKIAVGPPFYNRVNIPIGLMLGFAYFASVTSLSSVLHHERYRL